MIGKNVYRLLTAMPGDTINELAGDLRREASREKQTVYGLFNDIILTVEPGENDKSITDQYYTLSNERANKSKPSTGLTKRELLAGMAMQGILAYCSPGSAGAKEIIVSESVKYADALLEALEAK